MTGQPINDELLDRKTLFVRSIPLDVTNDQLSDFFSQFAPVRHAVIVNDDEKKSRGFGFVSFTSDDDTLAALQQAKKAKLNDRLLRVDVAKRRDRKERHSKAATEKTVSPEEIAIQKTSRLIIRNLPWSVRKPEDLAKPFRKFGTVKEAKIPKKKDGRLCGFGFITMSKHANAENAVKESSGLKIDGREVAVDFAVNKTHWGNIKPEAESKQETDNTEEESQVNDDDEDAHEEHEETEKTEDAEESEDEENVELGEDNDDSDSDSEVHEEDAKLLELEDTGFGDNKQKRNRQERYNVFVRNLPYDVTEESLKAHFEKLGPVKYALPVVDKETGLPRGTAFVAFLKNEAYEECILNAPEVVPNSVLLPDDVSPFYVFEGRIMQIVPALDRESAAKMAEKAANNRKDMLGRLPKESDKRNLYLLNEGRIGPNSKIAQFLSQSDMDIRQRSHTLRVEQLKKNPGLHLSMTRLAIRNLPRAMNDKSLKALGRKAIVEFATEMKEGLRQPLSKEEIDRSTKQKHLLLEKLGITDADEKKKISKHGVVSQAKVINEVKGSGEFGRSRGYGFLEYRDHKHALMALRWLNAHEVNRHEIIEGLTPEQIKSAEMNKTLNKRRLIVEFAIENANVVKRRNEQIAKSRKQSFGVKRKRDDDDKEGEKDNYKGKGKNGNFSKDNNKRQKPNKGKRGNMNKGPGVGKKDASKSQEKDEKSETSVEVKRIIGKKRRQRKQGKN